MLDNTSALIGLVSTVGPGAGEGLHPQMDELVSLQINHTHERLAASIVGTDVISCTVLSVLMSLHLDTSGSTEVTLLFGTLKQARLMV